MRSKHWWMANVQRIIKEYPELRQRKDEAQKQSTTAAYSADPRGGGTGRTTEMAALRSLAPEEERCLTAVDLALADADIRGPEIRRYVQLHYWRGIKTGDVADIMHVAPCTCVRWNQWLVRKVAQILGLYAKH